MSLWTWSGAKSNQTLIDVANNVATDFSHTITDQMLSMRFPAVADCHDRGSNAWHFALSLVCKSPQPSIELLPHGPVVPESSPTHSQGTATGLRHYVCSFAFTRQSFCYTLVIPWLIA